MKQKPSVSDVSRSMQQRLSHSKSHKGSAKVPINPLRVSFCTQPEQTPPYVRLRLSRVTANACSKFHIDAITARLVCTYRGTGTQYGISHDGGGPKRMFTVPTGSPILLRGTLWPESPRSGLLHRSPPIEGSGETRLVLVLDPIFDPEEET